ncbi:endolytic transglycosylase MltG [Cochleicola gelatinilyticus]|uniref:Endolytic murein transglycosylase n=1 Tax=Cochleicola gelatinilyticus TaxID=1763537 RepID=A0A167HCP2_9FLAO|nr:endolytic transglycosylase MltG [Cochleicola gelatinilyticus]OAB78482.1 aminodeoxychorismate lyase [Cochleicola gelatinilyticus]
MYLKKIVVAVALLGLVIMAGFAWYVYNAVFIPNTAFNNTEAHIYIPSNASFSEVLEEVAPLLEDIDSFEAVAKRKGYSTNIRPGHYIIKKGMNNNDLVNTLRSTNVPIQVKFNNQERLEDLAGHISRQIEADSASLIQTMRESKFLSSNGFSEATALAMYIPNTYEFYWNSSAETFRDKMKTEYNRFWNETRINKANALNLTKVQVMSLASIVQKETAKTDERPRVAGVYINRLKKGMLLQADPTVIYAKKKAENDFDQVIKRVLYKDLELDSPYNTYKFTGVPPGPIAMPDITSIDGVLNYEDHDYLYFVANVTNFGYHKFAKTLAQHNRNKAEYVRWVNANGINR